MHYQISRNGQMYGPYTREDLERYVASGNVLPSDLARSEEMAEWIPVSQLLGGSAASGPPPAGAAAYSPPAQPGYPPAYPPAAYGPPGAAPAGGPPDLHWGLVLLFDLLTCSLFQMVWNIVLAAWFKRVFPASKTLIFYIASAVLLVMQAVMGNALGLMIGRHSYYGPGLHYNTHAGGYGIYGLVATISWIVRLVARFTFRSELEQHFNTVDPIGLRLNPVLTFFFGGIYIQSQMNRINQIKRYGQPYR